jgi:hypothetical protein
MTPCPCFHDLLIQTNLFAVCPSVFLDGLVKRRLILRFERVDNWGAHSIPSETGLFVPSDYNG